MVTIDTEVDRSVDWSISDPVEFSSVLSGISARLTPLFERHGVRPTYMLSAEVIEHSASVDILKSLPNAELATHLHGETVNSKTPVESRAGQFMQEIQCSLSKDIEFNKLKLITDLFTSKFGYPPRSFRAGRFGIGRNTLALLSELGYEFDTSVTPGIDWNLREGRSDHSKAPTTPYFGDRNEFNRAGSLSILELPVTIRPAHRKLSKIADLFKVLDRRPFRKILHPLRIRRWMRPHWSSSEEMIDLVRRGLDESAGTDDTVVLNMMFHSMEIMAGKSPYTQTESEVNQYLDDIDRVFEFAYRSGCKFATLSEAGDIVRESISK